jgi:hypothetical protein
MPKEAWRNSFSEIISAYLTPHYEIPKSANRNIFPKSFLHSIDLSFFQGIPEEEYQTKDNKAYSRHEG